MYRNADFLLSLLTNSFPILRLPHYYPPPTTHLLTELLGNGPFQNRILIAAGLCFAADSMEILLLSFLTVVLRAEWNLTETQTNSITSSVFIGALAGTLILGPLGDRIGRKPVFTVTAAIICVFGLWTAATNQFETLLACRFMVGFGVGGLTVPFDTLAEFVPTSHRGTNLLFIEYFWTAGTMLVPVAAYVSLGNDTIEDGKQDNSWRVFVILCAIPSLISTILGLIYVPESPRWLLAQGRHDEAVSILRTAAICNGKNPDLLFPVGTQVIDEEDEGDSNCFDLLSPKWRKITLTLWGTWAGFAFVYYGTIIAITLIFDGSEQTSVDSDQIYSFDYGAIFTSASAELAGTTLIILLVDRVGRIPSQSASYLLGGISVFCLCILASQDNPHRGQLILTSFLARMFFMSASCATWVSTAEILTTEIRTTGHSAANAVARFSGAFCPYVVSSTTSFRTIGTVLLTISVSTCLFAWNLPETKGKSMGAIGLDHKRDSIGGKSPETVPEQSELHSFHGLT
jgi:MFS family permease